MRVKGVFEFNKFRLIVAEGAYSVSIISCVGLLFGGFDLPQNGQTIYPS